MARGCSLEAGCGENFSTFGRQSVRPSSQVPRASASAGRSRKKCSVSTKSGVSPLIRLRGLIRSVGSSWLPQLSHWSPRRAVVAADRAGALDVAVGQGASGRRRDRAHRRLRDDVAVAVQGAEQLLDDGVVVAGRRPGEQVVAQAEPSQVLDDDAVVAVGQLAGRHALGVGLHLDRRAVLVGAADHQDVVARHPHVPAEHVGGHSEAGHVADVPRAVGVGPGDRGEDVAGHAASLRAPRHPNLPTRVSRAWAGRA